MGSYGTLCRVKVFSSKWVVDCPLGMHHLFDSNEEDGDFPTLRFRGHQLNYVEGVYCRKLEVLRIPLIHTQSQTVLLMFSGWSKIIKFKILYIRIHWINSITVDLFISSSQVRPIVKVTTCRVFGTKTASGQDFPIQFVFRSNVENHGSKNGDGVANREVAHSLGNCTLVVHVLVNCMRK